MRSPTCSHLTITFLLVLDVGCDSEVSIEPELEIDRRIYSRSADVLRWSGAAPGGAKRLRLEVKRVERYFDASGDPDGADVELLAIDRFELELSGTACRATAEPTCDRDGCEAGFAFEGFGDCTFRLSAEAGGELIERCVSLATLPKAGDFEVTISRGCSRSGSCTAYRSFERRGAVHAPRTYRCEKHFGFRCEGDYTCEDLQLLEPFAQNPLMTVDDGCPVDDHAGAERCF